MDNKYYFLDTNVGITRISMGEEAENLNKYLEGNELITSTFVLMEFKKTVINDGVFLYSLLEENKNAEVKDVYWRIHNMLKSGDPILSRQAERLDILLRYLGYPYKKEKKYFLIPLENLLKRQLQKMFLNRVTLIESLTKCTISKNKVHFIGDSKSLTINLNCSETLCNIQQVIKDNTNLIKKIQDNCKKMNADFLKLSKVFLEFKNCFDTTNFGPICDILIALDAKNYGTGELLSNNLSHMPCICKNMCLNSISIQM